MAKLAIRQSGGANILSIPKAVLKILNLHVGSRLILTIEDNKIVLTPMDEQTALEALLAGSPRERLGLTEEDEQWLDSPSVGEEF